MGLRKAIKKFIYKSKFRKVDLGKINLSNKSIFITGANSGIGFQLTKKFLELNNKVYAIFRENSDNLTKLKNDNLKIIQCDLSNLDNIDQIKQFIQNKDINILINNAASFGSQDEQNYNNLDYNEFKRILNLNSLSVLKLVNTIIQFSNKKSIEKIINISSEMGSISNNKDGNYYLYRTSKSALNSITKNLSIDLNKENNIVIFSIHPGGVKTKMNSSGLIEPSKCAENLIHLIGTSDSSFNGKFLDLQSLKEINW